MSRASTAYADDFKPLKGLVTGVKHRHMSGVSACVCASRHDIGRPLRHLETDADQKGFGRLVARRLGFHGFDGLETLLEEFHELGVAASVKNLANERATGREVVLGKF